MLATVKVISNVFLLGTLIVYVVVKSVYFKVSPLYFHREARGLETGRASGRGRGRGGGGVTQGGAGW